MPTSTQHKLSFKHALHNNNEINKKKHLGYLEHVKEYAETAKEEAVMARHLRYLKIPGYLLTAYGLKEKLEHEYCGK